MYKAKGCSNESCSVRKNKIKYKESFKYCTKCGNKLTYVCKDCYTQLDGAEKYCVRCKAKHEGRNRFVAMAGGAATLGVAVMKGGRKALETIKSIKG